MAVNLRCSTDPEEDPFTGTSVFSLLPRTLLPVIRSLTTVDHDPQPPPHAAENDGVYFRTLLNSMMSKESAKLLEQCQAISSKQLMNDANMKFDQRDKVLMNGKDSMQSRRPALGRKRARFSLKPDSRLSLPTSEIHSSIEGIEDPEEYFLACENLENAEKELRKMRRDACTEHLDQKLSTTSRRHRPGISRRTVEYKHLVASSDNVEGTALSQGDIYNVESSSQSRIGEHLDAGSSLHSEQRVGKSLSTGTSINRQHSATGEEGSISKEKKVDDLFNILLAREDLDEENGQAFLLESLQIQHVDVGNLHLPDLPSFQKDEINVLVNGSLREKEENANYPALPTILSSPLHENSASQRQLSLKTRPDKLLDGDNPSPNRECSPKGKNVVFERSDAHHCDTTDAIARYGFVTVGDDLKRSSIGAKVGSPVDRMSNKVGDMIKSIKSHKLVFLKDSSENGSIGCQEEEDDQNAQSIGKFSQNRDQFEGSTSSPLETDSGSGIAPLRESQSTPMLANKNRYILENKSDTWDLGSGKKVETKTNREQQLVMHSPVDGDFRYGLDSDVFGDGYNGRQGKENDNSRVEMTNSTQEIPGLEGVMLNKHPIEHSISLVERGMHFDQRKAGNKEEVNSAGAGVFLHEVETRIDQSTAEHCSELSRGRSSGDTDPLGRNMSANKMPDVLVHAEPGSHNANNVDDGADYPEATSEDNEHLQNASSTVGETHMELQSESTTLPKRGRKRKIVAQRHKKQNDLTRQSRADTGASTSDGNEKLLCMKKQKVLSRRQSLAGSGMTWQSGVRRSTETSLDLCSIGLARDLYMDAFMIVTFCGEPEAFENFIQFCLATVIGVKYASPSDSKLKVKSYVSEEYAELVAQASLY